MGTTKRRKVRDESDAQALLYELKHSGLSLPAFCAGQGVDGRSLSCWRHNLLVRARSSDVMSEAQPLRLVEVVTSPAAVSAPTSASYKLSIGGVCIEVDDRFLDAMLARLVRGAATC